MPLNAGSQGKGAATGDLAIAALDPTYTPSERTPGYGYGLPRILERGPRPLRGPPFPSE